MRDADTVRFFFSLRSPYSWLAFERIERVLAPLQVPITYLAVFPPSEADLPLLPPPPPSFEFIDPFSNPDRLRYTWIDVRRFADEYGLAFRPPTVLDTDWSLVHGAYYLASRSGLGRAFAGRAFRLRFCEDVDIGSRSVISQIAGECGLEISALWRDLEPRSYGPELAEAFGQYWHFHCFGVPTFEYAGEIFWGNDRLEMLYRHVLSARSR